MSTQVIERDVDPGVIVSDPAMNARFGLRPARIKKLAEDIKEAGAVLHRVGLYEAEDGKYHIKYGNYRVAAINLLNTEGAMLKVPAVIYPAPTGETARMDILKTNLMENLSRQDLTLMDQAAAMKALEEAGEDKLKIREMFARPGRKGPASNSWVNITMGFLDLPKKVQNQIHEGLIDWAGAADLVKINRTNKEKLPEVLAELDEARKKAIDREEREEERFLNTLKRAEEQKSKAELAVQEAVSKEAERATKLIEAQAAVNKAKSDAAATLVKFDEALKAATAKVVQDASAAAEVAKITKDLQAARSESDKDILKAQKVLDALVDKGKKEAEAAKERVKAEAEKAKAAIAEAKKETEERQPGGTAKKKASEKATGAADVKKAAAKVGASSQLVPLNRKSIMEVTAMLALPGGQGKAEKIVQTIGECLTSCFNGGLTDKQCYSAILKAVGGK